MLQMKGSRHSFNRIGEGNGTSKVYSARAAERQSPGTDCPERRREELFLYTGQSYMKT